MTYALVLIDTPAGGVPAAESGGEYFALSAILPGLQLGVGSDLLGVIENWATVQPLLEGALAAGRLPPPLPVKEPSYLCPIRRPANIICAGSNYYDHLEKDFGVTNFDKPGNDVLYFTKSAGSLGGHGTKVRYPSQSVAFDWEIELVVVIGKAGRRIPLAEAIQYVAGYTIGLDLTARDLQFNKRQRRQFDLFGGKAFDDSAPVGPRIVPAKFIDPEDLALRLAVNGEIRQDSHTREMIWNIPELISDVSQHITLQPGDLLFTGSPAGVGHVSGTYLNVGDRIDADIDKLGRLSVEIVEDPDAARVWDRQQRLATVDE